MTPPPSPRAPATHPPPNPSPSTFLKVLPLNIKSLSTLLMLPNFSFNDYSYAVNLQEMYTWMVMKIMKRASDVQSPGLHLSNTLPLKRELVKSKNSTIKLIPCFFHCPWLLSCLTSERTISTSFHVTGSLALSIIGRPYSSS